MSRQNKVNPDHYTQAGRLSPDDLARERRRQREQDFGRRGRNQKGVPPWMANETTGGGGSEVASGATPHQENEAAAATADAADDDKGEIVGAGMPRRKAANKAGAPASRKGKRPAPRQRSTGKAAGAGRAAKKSTKASGARAMATTRKAPKARGSAARRSSPQRAGKPAAPRGRTTASGTKTQKQKKGR